MLPICSKTKSNMEPRLGWQFFINYVSIRYSCPVSIMTACSCFPSENCWLADALDLNWVDIMSENSKQQEKYSKMTAICMFLIWLFLALSLAVLRSQQLYPTIFLSQNHWMGQLGRDHGGSSGPASLLKQGHPRVHYMELSRQFFSISSKRDSKTSLKKGVFSSRWDFLLFKKLKSRAF